MDIAVADYVDGESKLLINMIRNDEDEISCDGWACDGQFVVRVSPGVSTAMAVEIERYLNTSTVAPVLLCDAFERYANGREVDDAT